MTCLHAFSRAKTRATLSTNENQNKSWLACTRFPALKRAPLCQSMRTKTNRDLLARIFPRLAHAFAWNSFELWLFQVCCDWSEKFALVLVWFNNTKMKNTLKWVREQRRSSWECWSSCYCRRLSHALNELESAHDFIKIAECITPLFPFNCKLLFISKRLNSQAATTSVIFSLQARRFFSNNCHVSSNWRKLLSQLPSKTEKSHKIFSKLNLPRLKQGLSRRQWKSGFASLRQNQRI